MKADQVRAARDRLLTPMTPEQLATFVPVSREEIEAALRQGEKEAQAARLLWKRGY